jgi:GNAT superfamily N-acetyltransferase
MMIIRAATVQDCARLTQIAREAKAHWGYAQRWLEGWQDVLTIKPTQLSDWQILVAEIDAAAIGFVALAPGPEVWTIEHMWVLPSHMGQGVGRILFDVALQLARDKGARCMEIDADPNAAGFYRQCGAFEICRTAAPVDTDPQRTLPRLRLNLHTGIAKLDT